MFWAYKPFKVLGRWYCGPKYTEVGKAAKVVCSISTLLMTASGALLYEYCVSKNMLRILDR